MDTFTTSEQGQPESDSRKEAMELFYEVIGGMEDTQEPSKTTEIKHGNDGKEPFDSTSFLLNQSSTAATLATDGGQQAPFALFCCAKARLLITLDDNTTTNLPDHQAVSLLNDFISHAPSIRLRDYKQEVYADPEYLVVIADKKTQKIHWFMYEDKMSDDRTMTIRSWKEFERADAEPKFALMNTLNRIADEYNNAGISKTPAFCPIHGEGTSRWFLTVVKKNEQERGLAGSLLTQGFPAPPVAVSLEEYHRLHGTNKK